MSDLILPPPPSEHWTGRRVMRCAKGHTLTLPENVKTFDTMALTSTVKTGPLCPECLVKFLQQNVPTMTPSTIVSGAARSGPAG